jgi:AcrR family transcriptional regulator
MAPKVTEAHLEARREQILAGALTCFARQGFHQTTMQDICHEAQLSPGAVYRYFVSKDAIIAACCGGNQQRAFELIDTAMAREGTQAVFTELADAFLRALDQPEMQPQLMVTVQLWGETLRSPEVSSLVQEGNDGIRARFADLVRQAQAIGEINPDLDPDGVARTMMAVYAGLVLQKAREPDMAVGPFVQAVMALYVGRFWTGGKGTVKGPARRLAGGTAGARKQAA